MKKEQKFMENNIDEQGVKGNRRRIYITKESRWEEIRAIQELPEYKSFQAVISDALDRGLPILYNELFGQPEDDPIEEPAPNNAPYDNCPDNEFCWNATVLLREINMNLLIIKDLVSGHSQLFSALLHFFPQYDEIANLFDGGKLNVIPECLEQKETEMLKKITALNRKAEKR